ncbi:MAG: hypothetical protein M5U28_12895 [Sandaracinaceae bacterium]|nr:hypothetical protein [Sandaracinaceae bacterium]
MLQRELRDLHRARGSCTTEECVDAGSEGDAGAPREDAGLACGAATCASGELCCPGCAGAMTCEPGPSCLDVTCAPECGPSQPCGEGEYCEMRTAPAAAARASRARWEAARATARACAAATASSTATPATHSRRGRTWRSTAGARPRAARPWTRAGEGVCAVTLGFAFDGTRCVGIHCSCVGADCSALYATSDACESAYARCIFPTCGGFIGTGCGDDAWCDYAADEYCGFADGSGVCRPRPADCAGEPSVTVCGCDGTTYASACEAHRAGVDDASSGPCEPPPPP